MAYNIISCSGFEDRMACAAAKLLGVVLFFLLAMVRKWGGEMMGLSFSLLAAAVVGMGVYLIVISLFGNVGIAFGIGLLAGVAGGYVGGIFFEGGEE